VFDQKVPEVHLIAKKEADQPFIGADPLLFYQNHRF